MSGCARTTTQSLSQVSCAPGALSVITGETGKANVFLPDPVSRSGMQNLSPNSLDLDQFHIQATLAHLSGRGVLEGKYIEVRNGLQCNEGFGAFEPTNEFIYSHSDVRFQEAMSYHFGDQYRASLDETGYLLPKTPVEIVAHCMHDDNAFFVRGSDFSGRIVEKVCLGDSVATPGASYADDAFVTVHELQHSATVNTYSLTDSLNQFWYDEAGGLNEAISDFMGLMFFAPTLPVSFDPRVFSRWALGTFIPNQVGTRGAHRCPTYDPTYPNCTGYPGFSAATSTVSYVYPDGMGWPYANNFDAPGYLRSIYLNYRSFEEIHNIGILMEGALWEAYEAIKVNHGGDAGQAQSLMTKVVMQALQGLPKPTIANISPVNYRGFAAAMVNAGELISLSAADQASLVDVLRARGLYQGETLSLGWASASSTGIRIEDDPTLLKKWLLRMGVDSGLIGALVTQNLDTGLNGRLDPGEAVAVWFDIQNNSPLTAGGVRLTVTSLDPDVIVLGPEVNIGAVSDERAQMIYGKIHGTGILPSLTSANPSLNVPTGNTYFLTNPAFHKNFTTAIWLKVSKDIPHGRTVQFDIGGLPSNGDGQVSHYLLDVVIN